MNIISKELTILISIPITLVLLSNAISFGQSTDTVRFVNQQNTIDSLTQQIEALQYTELVQSMSQRSLLTPNYLIDLKALIARQAYNFWAENPTEVFISHLNIYLALHDANKYFEYDSINHTYYNQIKEHKKLVISIVCGTDSDEFYSASSDGKILKWDLSNLSKPPIVLFEKKVIFRSMDVSFDGKWLLAPTKEHGVLIVSTVTPSLGINNEVFIPSFSHDREIVQSAIFLPDELKYLTVTKNGEVKIKGYGLNSVKTRTGEKVRALAINTLKDEVYAGTRKGVVLIWNEKFIDRYLDIPELYAINALAISSDQRLLAIGRVKGDALIWDMENKEVVRIISGHQSAITDIDFSPDNKLLLTSSRDKTARVWDIYESKKLPLVLSDHDDWVMTASFDKSGTKIITGSKDRSIRVWPIDPKKLADRICSFSTRNLTLEEWREYVGENIAYQDTCPLSD